MNFNFYLENVVGMREKCQIKPSAQKEVQKIFGGELTRN